MQGSHSHSGGWPALREDKRAAVSDLLLLISGESAKSRLGLLLCVLTTRLPGNGWHGVIGMQIASLQQ